MKTRTLLIYLAVCAAMFAALAYTPVLLRYTSTSAPAATAQPASAQEDPSSAPLFPGVAAENILALSVTAADRSFEFTRTGSHVSVNGRTADRDMFSTLLRQIANMPITPGGAFSPGKPLMTILVESGDVRHAAQFFENPGEDTVDVSYTIKAAQHYGVTDAWRLGTLLLACDGTRILDERGYESPADSDGNGGRE